MYADTMSSLADSIKWKSNFADNHLMESMVEDKKCFYYRGNKEATNLSGLNENLPSERKAIAMNDVAIFFLSGRMCKCEYEYVRKCSTICTPGSRSKLGA